MNRVSRLALVLGVVMVVLVSMVACGTSTSPTPTGTPTPAPGTTPGPNDVVSIVITPALPDTLQLGDTQQFTATATYGDGRTANISTLVQWGSSNTDVAIVNSAGLVTAVTNGNTIIAACYLQVCMAVNLVCAGG